jgi:hypothetical protein
MNEDIGTKIRYSGSRVFEFGNLDLKSEGEKGIELI